MPKYLVTASYTPEGARGVLRAGGTSRRDAVAKLAEDLGGSLESFYFAFGGTDVFVVLDLPDNESAAAASLAVGASGAATAQVVVLLAPADIDTASQRAVSYRAPGS